MIDFLKKCGVDDITINNIIINNVDANLFNLSCNSDEVIKIVQYLRGLGINCINDLLTYKINIFFNSFDDFKIKYIKQDIDNFVKVINEDYMLIDEM